MNHILKLYAKTARVGKFKLNDFCSKGEHRPITNGIKHENGYQIASDAHILAVIKKSYPPEWEGKIIHAKTGKAIEGVFPNYNNVRPNIEEYHKIELPPLDIKELKAEYKLAKATRNYSFYQIDIEGVRFNIEMMLRFYPIIARLGGTMYIGLEWQPMYIVNELDEWALIVPVLPKMGL